MKWHAPHDVEQPLAQAEGGHEGKDAGELAEAVEDQRGRGVRLPVVPAAQAGHVAGEEGLDGAGRGEGVAEAVDFGEAPQDLEEREAVHAVDLEGLGAGGMEGLEGRGERLRKQQSNKAEQGVREW